MIDAYCNTCNEGRVLLPLVSGGSCPYCGGRPNECECGEFCNVCENPLEIGDTWRAE
jgi:hypothetical protein